MSRKRYKPEQIISMLREADVQLSRGQKNRRSAGPPEDNHRPIWIVWLGRLFGSLIREENSLLFLRL
jgi:hypothetical protein